MVCSAGMAMDKLGELVLNGHTHPINALAMSKDGLTLITVSDDNTCRFLRLFDSVFSRAYSGLT
jgi:hypothetical protein